MTREVNITFEHETRGGYEPMDAVVHIESYVDKHYGEDADGNRGGVEVESTYSPISVTDIEGREVPISEQIIEEITCAIGDAS